MRPLQTDLSVFNKLDFERPPVGVKYLFFRPEGMERLSMDKKLSFCEILREAQHTVTPFTSVKRMMRRVSAKSYWEWRK